MKNISVNNPHEKEYTNFKNIIQNSVDKKSKSLLKDKAFCEEYKAVYLVVSVLILILGLSLALTSLTALEYILRPVIDKWSFFIALIVCISIEGIKIESGKVALKSYHKYSSIKSLPSALYILATICSLGLSVYGVYRIVLNDELESNIESPTLVDISKFTKDNDKRIDSLSLVAKDIKEQIEGTKSNSTKRALNTSLVLVMEQSNFYKEKGERKERKTEKVNTEKMRTYEESKILEQKTAKVSNQRAAFDFSIFALICEIVLFLCYNFNFYYYYRNEVHNTGGFGVMNEGSKELETVYINRKTESKEIDKQLLIQANTIEEKEPKTRKKIGFGRDKTGINIQAVKNTEPKNVKESKVSNGLCLNPNCGKSFERKSVLKKYCSDKCRGVAYRLRKAKL